MIPPFQHCALLGNRIYLEFGDREILWVNVGGTRCREIWREETKLLGQNDEMKLKWKMRENN